MRHPHLVAITAIVLAGVPAVATAQAVRGSVVDGAERPVAGVVVQLLDSLEHPVARALTAERGDFRLGAPHAGSFRLRSLRIGYRPTLSGRFVLAPGETRTEAVHLAGITLSLDTMRVVSSNSCKGSVDAGAATFAVLDQARTALSATELTNATRSITATTLTYDRVLDPNGRRVRKQETSLHAQQVREPWAALAPDSLHRIGYVVRDATDSTTYYAPGLDMLASDTFVADHCFELRREPARIAIVFEPRRERGDVPEISGTIWLDVATSNLQQLEFTYVNLPSEVDAVAGAQLDFARLTDGGWIINSWRIRMPVLERRLRSQAFGGNGTFIRELKEEGGELVLAARGRDTLWAQTPRVLTGTVRDSVTGREIPRARLMITGLGIGATADERGHYELGGLLFGDYGVVISTASLDSVGVTAERAVTFTGTRPVDINVPTGASYVAGMCGGTLSVRQAGVFGHVTGLGGAPVPHDATVSVEWRDLRLRGTTDEVVVSTDLRQLQARPDSSGAYHVCGVPADTHLIVRAVSDSATAEPVPLRPEDIARVTRVDLVLERGNNAFATLSGVVRRDSAGVPVAGADVSIGDIGKAVLTDEKGAYRIADIPPGAYHVTVRKLGLAAFDTVLTFTRGRATRHVVTLAKTQVLNRVTTRATALPPSFDDHYRIGLGSFLTRDQLAKQEGARLADVVSQLRGLRIVADTRHNELWPTSARRADCSPELDKMKLCPPDTSVMLRCWSQVYVDRVLVNRGNPTLPFNLNEFPVDRIEAVEYFAGASETPSEYSTLNSTCGVLVLWTRRSP